MCFTRNTIVAATNSLRHANSALSPPSHILLHSTFPRFHGTATIAPYIYIPQGPESFTTDNQYILGEAPELNGLFMCTGMNSSGIASSGGAGKALAEWIVEGEPTQNLWPVDVRRFGPHHRNINFLRERTSETLGLHYAMPWPGREAKTGRDLRHSPSWSRLRDAGAVFGQNFAWERPNYFVPPCADGTPDEARRVAAAKPTFGQPGWLEIVREECVQTRDRCSLFDVTSFAKFVMDGPDALRAMQQLCANNVDVAPGTVVYTGMLNARGGYETDVTVTRLADDTFFIVSPTGQATRDACWIRGQLNAPAVGSGGSGDSGGGGGRYPHAQLRDVTNAWSVLSLMGPLARPILGRTSMSDVSEEAFPFGTARDIDVGSAMVNARRTTYVGEHGWELFVPSESAHHVYDSLFRAAAEMDAEGGEEGERDEHV